MTDFLLELRSEEIPARMQAGARAELESSGGNGAIYRIQKLEEDGIADVSRLPFSIKILLDCTGYMP